MNDVDKRFDEQFNFTAGQSFTDDEKFDGLVLGEELKAFIHVELRKQAEEIIDSLPEWQNDKRVAHAIHEMKWELRQKYLSDPSPAKPE